jgi:cardiolipin synthase (CMP-forming)
MKIIWNSSNLLSLLRLFLAVPLFIFILNGDYGIVVVTLFLASLTDILDGYVARKFNQITEFGKVIDPLADKVFVSALVIALLLQGRIPLWFFFAIALRDILILLGGMFMAKKQKVVPPSNFYGKMAVSGIGITLLLDILNVLSPDMLLFAMIITTFLLVLSFSVYLKNFFKLFK